MEDLLDKAINQNYVPVVDDQGYFIGIITRKEIIKYCYKELKKYVAASNAEKTESQIDSPENWEADTCLFFRKKHIPMLII